MRCENLPLILCFVLLSVTFRVKAQEADSAQAGQTPSTQGAVSTGGAHPAVLDSEHRPITAGGFVDNGPVVFQDIAEKAGLAVASRHGHRGEEIHSGNRWLRCWPA